MALDVVGGERDGDQVGDAALAEFFAGDEGLGEVEFVAVGSRSAADEIEELRGAVDVGLVLGLGDAAACVEGCGPLGQMLHVVGGGGELAAGVVDPEGAVG